jgi:hypothetical protein
MRQKRLYSLNVFDFVKNRALIGRPTQELAGNSCTTTIAIMYILFAGKQRHDRTNKPLFSLIIFILDDNNHDNNLLYPQIPVPVT